MFGEKKFSYLYYIDRIYCSDRVISLENDNDIQYDEEFYKILCG